MRAAIVELIEKLVVRHATTRRLDLNDIAEVIGTRAVSYEEVDAIVCELEARGCSVGGPPTPREMELLREILAAIRKGTAERGRRPSVEEIAEAVDIPAFAVRRALENARELGRRGATKAGPDEGSPER